MQEIITKKQLEGVVRSIVDRARVYDIHTHIYSEAFGNLVLWGIDELLTYHYLVAEFFRYSSLKYEAFWALDKKEKADLIWDELFIKRSPVSEACRGVLTVLNKLGVDATSRNLDEIRQFFYQQSLNQHIDLIWEIGHIEKVVMTNDPFDDTERPIWEKGGHDDKRFKASLRIDPLLNDWENTYQLLKAWGYDVAEDFSGNTIEEIRHFLTDWISKMKAIYMAVSLPPSFGLESGTACTKIIEDCIIPVSLKLNVPFAMLIGAIRGINPGLKTAGDAAGKADISVIHKLCARYPYNKFMATMLSRENQHELCIAGRKFRNLMIFGCWWFLNNPSIVDEITRERLETLGLSFIPQHSDSRVLEQLIYKWAHFKRLIADVLIDKYGDIIDSGWNITTEDVERDVRALFSSNFTDFLHRKI